MLISNGCFLEENSFTALPLGATEIGCSCQSLSLILVHSQIGGGEIEMVIRLGRPAGAFYQFFVVFLPGAEAPQALLGRRSAA